MEAKNPLDRETTNEEGRAALERNYKTTEGEHLVGKSFNPGGSPDVDNIKRMAAELIDYIRFAGKDPRCTQIAITEIEAAAMWGVKSVTKQPRE